MAIFNAKRTGRISMVICILFLNAFFVDCVCEKKYKWHKRGYGYSYGGNYGSSYNNNNDYYWQCTTNSSYSPPTFSPTPPSSLATPAPTPPMQSSSSIAPSTQVSSAPPASQAQTSTFPTSVSTPMPDNSQTICDYDPPTEDSSCTTNGTWTTPNDVLVGNSSEIVMVSDNIVVTGSLTVENGGRFVVVQNFIGTYAKMEITQLLTVRDNSTIVVILSTIPDDPIIVIAQANDSISVENTTVLLLVKSKGQPSMADSYLGVNTTDTTNTAPSSLPPAKRTMKVEQEGHGKVNSSSIETSLGGNYETMQGNFERFWSNEDDSTKDNKDDKNGISQCTNPNFKLVKSRNKMAIICDPEEIQSDTCNAERAAANAEGKALGNSQTTSTQTSFNTMILSSAVVVLVTIFICIFGIMLKRKRLRERKWKTQLDRMGNALEHDCNSMRDTLDRSSGRSQSDVMGSYREHEIYSQMSPLDDEFFSEHPVQSLPMGGSSRSGTSTMKPEQIRRPPRKATSILGLFNMSQKRKSRRNLQAAFSMPTETHRENHTGAKVPTMSCDSNQVIDLWKEIESSKQVFSTRSLRDINTPPKHSDNIKVRSRSSHALNFISLGHLGKPSPNALAKKNRQKEERAQRLAKKTIRKNAKKTLSKNQSRKRPTNADPMAFVEGREEVAEQMRIERERKKQAKKQTNAASLANANSHQLPIESISAEEKEASIVPSSPNGEVLTTATTKRRPLHDSMKNLLTFVGGSHNTSTSRTTATAAAHASSGLKEVFTPNISSVNTVHANPVVPPLDFSALPRAKLS